MQKTSTASPGQTADNFVDLTTHDLPAVVAHLQALDDRDFHLRFGGVARQPDVVLKIASRLFQMAHVFGLWDAAHVKLLVLGSYGQDPMAKAPGSFDVSLSALRECRGGMGKRVAAWLQPRMVAQGAQQIELMFHASNRAVVKLATGMGLTIQCEGAECTAHLDLKPTADAIHDWLDRLDQLLEAVRNDSEPGAGAKL